MLQGIPYTVNYYEHHLGDYVKDTAHLSLIEEGAYRRLLDVYYIREKPLPADRRECHRLARAVSKADIKAVDYVLVTFFKLSDEGFRHKRCDEEIARYKAKSEAGKVGANARWSHNGRNANASPSHANGNAIAMPSSPQSPISSNHIPTPTPSQEGVVRETRAERKDRKQEALQAWNQLVNSGGALGRDSPQVQRGISAAGGWPRIRMREQGAEDAMCRNAFVAAYIGSQS